MGSLARHETLVLGVLRLPKNFLNFRKPSSTCRKFRQVSRIFVNLTETVHKYFTRLHQTCGQFHANLRNLDEICTKGHIRTSCPPYYCPLCTFEKYWANLCERLRNFSEWRSKKSMARTGKGSRNEKNQRRSITRLGSKIIMLRRMRCHAHP